MDPHVQAILDTDDPTPFETLISDLMTSSNEQRSQAESLFKSCKQTDPNTLVAKLIHLLEHSPHLEARSMSAILLRNLFQQTDPNTLVQVKNGLLNCVVNEQNKPIIKLLGNTILELVADNGWPELMDFLLDLVASEDSRLQESALLIFAQLVQYVGDSLWPHIKDFNSVFMNRFGNVEGNLMPHIEDLHGVFMKCLGNIGSADVRIAALSAAINFIQCFKGLSDRDGFQDLFPGMMQCLTEALNNGNEAMVQKALVLLIEFAETDPSFFTGQVVEVVGSMLQIAEAESLEEGTRHLAIEFVFTLAEARELTPEIMRELPEFISRLFAILMRMLLDIEDEAAWHSAENDEDEDAGESSNYSIGQECLHRLAAVLGGNAVVRVAHEQLSAYLAASDREWQKHLAALVALAQIAKGRSKVNGGLQYTVITMVMNAFQNPRHPRVRWAAIHAIGKLATHVGPSWQDFFKNRVLTTLCLAQDDIRNPRVQETKNNFDQLLDLFQDSHHPSVRVVAINAICQFSINLDPKTQFQYHSRVLPALAEAINKDLDPLVRVAAINATCQLPTDLDPNLQLLYIPALAEAIYKDLDPRVRLAAINATGQLSINLDPNSQFQYQRLVLSALAAAIYEDPDPRVRLDAINAAFRLSTDLNPNLWVLDLYCSYVLPALHGAICDFKDLIVQEHAAFAMINISKNYPASPFQRHTVGILLEDHASSRERLELQHQEDIALDDIASDRNKISASESLLIKFELELPHDTWDSILARLTPNQQAEYLRHVGLNMAIYEDPDPLVRVAAINKTVRLFANLSTALHPEILPALAEAINKDLDPLVRVAAIKATCQLPTDFDPNLRLLYIPALAEAINKDLDPLVRAAAIKATSQLPTHDFYPNLRLFYIPALAEAINKDLDPHVRKAAIEACYRLPTDLDPDLLWRYIAALSEAIYEDLDQHVRLAAINATWHLSTSLDPNSQFQHQSHFLPALAAAIYEDPEPLVRLDAIDVTFRLSTYLDPNLPLPDLYGSYVLPALHGAICDFEYLRVQFDAVYAMINISKNYPLDTPRYLLVTVGTLLELRRREDIASDQTRIRAIRNILEAFEEELPHETLTETLDGLSRERREEFWRFLRLGD